MPIMTRFNNYYQWLTERYANEDKLLLIEGLIKSYPVDVLIKDLSKRYSEIEYNNKTGLLTVEKIPLKSRKSLINKLNLYGYFIGDEQVDAEDNTLFGVLIEPKYPAEIPFKILHNDIRYCYHITSDKYIDKIKRVGLILKESVRDFYSHSGNRIYFLISDKPNEDLPLLKNMLMSNDRSKNELNRPQKYFLLRINFNKLNDEMVFYRDPRLFPEGKFKGLGIFTLSNISSDKIEFMGEI